MLNVSIPNKISFTSYGRFIDTPNKPPVEKNNNKQAEKKSNTPALDQLEIQTRLLEQQNELLEKQNEIIGDLIEEGVTVDFSQASKQSLINIGSKMGSLTNAVRYMK